MKGERRSGRGREMDEGGREGEGGKGEEPNNLGNESMPVFDLYVP